MQKAFTLIEVLVVVCILGCVAALTIPFFFPRHIPTTGVVVGKRYQEGHTSWIPQSTGKSIILIPYYNPPRYIVDVKDDVDHKEYSVDVPPTEYEHFKSGSDWGDRKVEKSP